MKKRKKKMIEKPACDKLQRKKHKKQCIKSAVWRNSDKYTARIITDRRRI